MEKPESPKMERRITTDDDRGGVVGWRGESVRWKEKWYKVGTLVVPAATVVENKTNR
jgi:hypothetical protein